MTYKEYTVGGTGTFTISGPVNGTNTIFTLPLVPQEIMVYVNGLMQLDQAVGFGTFAYSIASNTITFNNNGSATPQTGDILTAWVWNA